MGNLSTLVSIVIVNLLLSGDNALVIALSSRRLPQQQQERVIFWGGVGAIGLRILLTLAAVELLQIRWLQFFGGLLLFWVAIKLVIDQQKPAPKDIKVSTGLREALKTILVADVVMSLDNVVALAGVSRGNIVLLIIGLVLSVPIILWGSKAIGILLDRWPLVILAGATFLGWTAGNMVITEQALILYSCQYPLLFVITPGGFALGVLMTHYFKTTSNNRA